MTNLLLKQVRFLDPVAKIDRVTDILLVEGIIKTIAPDISDFPENTEIKDAQDLILAPGLTDLYSHSGEPGFEERETLESLLNAATAGGFTRLTILPDTDPVIDNPGIVTWLRQKSAILNQNNSFTHLNFWGSITLNLEGKQLTELTDLAAGVIGFADGYSLENLGLVRRLLEYVKPLEKPVALVANNRQIQGNGVMREGIASISYGLPGNPAISETTALAALLELIAAIDTPVHLMRISTKRGVELIAEAKNRGVPVSASTTWSHLLFNPQAIANYDPNLRLEPPLGNPEDQQALISGVKEGIIDAIAIDHTPHTYEDKTVSFAETLPGVIGLELALPLLWQRFVTSGEWSALQLWQALSSKPQSCLQQQPQALLPEKKSELILFDPRQT